MHSFIHCQTCYTNISFLCENKIKREIKILLHKTVYIIDNLNLFPLSNVIVISSKDHLASRFASWRHLPPGVDSSTAPRVGFIPIVFTCTSWAERHKSRSQAFGFSYLRSHRTFLRSCSLEYRTLSLIGECLFQLFQICHSYYVAIPKLLQTL